MVSNTNLRPYTAGVPFRRADFTVSVSMLCWAMTNGCPEDSKMYVFAAKRGNVDVLRCLKLNGIQWHPFTCAAAALAGHLPALEWARGNGCPWGEMVAAHAAHGGDLKLLEWARENGCPVWDEVTCSVAAREGHLHVVGRCKLDPGLKAPLVVNIST